jgi:hypothetical protein
MSRPIRKKKEVNRFGDWEYTVDKEVKRGRGRPPGRKNKASEARKKMFNLSY